jgi:hypothetical protein
MFSLQSAILWVRQIHFNNKVKKKNNLILQQVTHFVDLATEMYLSFSPEDGSVRAETCRSDSVSGVNKCVH